MVKSPTTPHTESVRHNGFGGWGWCAPSGSLSVLLSIVRVSKSPPINRQLVRIMLWGLGGSLDRSGPSVVPFLVAAVATCGMLRHTKQATDRVLPGDRRRRPPTGTITAPRTVVHLGRARAMAGGWSETRPIVVHVPLPPPCAHFGEIQPFWCLV